MRKFLFLAILLLLGVGCRNAEPASEENLGLSFFVIEQGGTGTSTLPGAGQMLIGNGASYDFVASSSIGSGGSTAAGDTGQVQVNDTDSFAAYDTFTFTTSTAQLSVSNVSSSIASSTELCLVSGGCITDWSSSGDTTSSPGGSDQFIQYNNGGVFAGSALAQFNSSTGVSALSVVSSTDITSVTSTAQKAYLTDIFATNINATTVTSSLYGNVFGNVSATSVTSTGLYGSFFGNLAGNVNASIVTSTGLLFASGHTALATTTIATNTFRVNDTFFVDGIHDRVGINTTTPTVSLAIALEEGANVQGDGITISRDGGFFNMGQGTGSDTLFLPIIKGKAVGDTGFFIRGVQSDTQSAAEAIRFSAANATESGAIPDADNAFTFYNWATHLMTIEGGGDVGIGISNPTRRLHVEDDSAVPAQFTNTAASGSNGGAVLVLRHDDGSGMANGDRLGGFLFGGQRGGGVQADGAFIYAEASSNWNAGDFGSELVFDLAPNGSTTRQERMRITNDGIVEIGNSLYAGTVSTTDITSVTSTASKAYLTSIFASNLYSPNRYLSTPTANQSWDGNINDDVLTITTTTFGQVVYITSGGVYGLADASATSTAHGMLAMSLEAGIPTTTLQVALPGTLIRDNSWDWTMNTPIYLSETAGGLTTTTPTTALSVVRPIGYARSSTTIWFDPAMTIITNS